MISASFLGDGAALDRLQALPAAADAGIARAIAKLGAELQSNVQQNKLSGQVLNVRSGLLKSSIEVTVDQTGTGISATVSSDVDYAAANEYGFFGTVNVRASLRLIKEAFGRPIDAKTIGIRAYSRSMALPERSFLRSALADLAPNIIVGVQGALNEAIAQ